jgi:hypothetical protein
MPSDDLMLARAAPGQLLDTAQSMVQEGVGMDIEELHACFEPILLPRRVLASVAYILAIAASSGHNPPGLLLPCARGCGFMRRDSAREAARRFLVDTANT